MGCVASLLIAGCRLRQSSKRYSYLSPKEYADFGPTLRRQLAAEGDDEREGTRSGGDRARQTDQLRGLQAF